MTTLTTEQREDILSNMSDLYKDVHGFRNRSFNYSVLSDADLKSEYDYLIAQLDFKIEQEKIFQKQNYKAFKKHLNDVCTICNCSKRKAIRFMLDAYGLLQSKDYDFLCFHFGLNYSVAKEMKNYR
jgi:hypothetical protein